MDYFARAVDAIDDVKKAAGRVGYTAQWVAMAAMSVTVMALMGIVAVVVALGRL